MLLGKSMVIQSKLKIDYDSILKILINYDTHPINFMIDSLYGKENSANINYLKKKLEDDKEKLKQYLFDDDFLNKCEKLFKLKNSTKLNKNEKKLMEKLSTELDKKYLTFLEKKNLEELIDKNKKDIIYEELHIEKKILNILEILHDYEYVDIFKNINKEMLTIKGIIASQINECNCILMTEILIQKLLNNLIPEEIIGVFALFVDDTKDEEIKITNVNIKNVVDIVDELKIELMDTENNYSICTTIEITKDYVEIAYQWGCGKTFNEIENEYKIYVGNFIKCMLKIYNITREIINIIDITKDIELLPKLQKVSELVVRDIVNTNSLYLT